MRNIRKQIEQGHTIIAEHRNIDLLAEELQYLKDLFDEMLETKGISDAAYNIIIKAFHFGVAVGTRNGRREAAR